MERKIAQILESEGKSKAKVKILSEALKSGAIAPKAVELAISEVEGPTRATLVEALEGATRKRQDLVDAHLFARIVECLWDAAPRVRWEAAKTLANTSHLLCRTHRGWQCEVCRRSCGPSRKARVVLAASLCTKPRVAWWQMTGADDSGTDGAAQPGAAFATVWEQISAMLRTIYVLPN